MDHHRNRLKNNETSFQTFTFTIIDQHRSLERWFFARTGIDIQIRNETKERIDDPQRNEVSVVPLIISMVAPGETNRAKRWTGNTANSMKIDSRRYRSLAPRRWQMSVFHESTFFDHRATDLFVTMFSNSPSATPSRILSTRRHRPASNYVPTERCSFDPRKMKSPKGSFSLLDTKTTLCELLAGRIF